MALETFRTRGLQTIPGNASTTAIATDSTGNLYICGALQLKGDKRGKDSALDNANAEYEKKTTELFVARTTLDGELDWWKTPLNFSSCAWDLAVYAGRVFVVGEATFPTDARADAVVLALDAATGDFAWPAVRRFGLAGDDAAAAVLIDDAVSPPVLHVAGRVRGRVFPAPGEPPGSTAAFHATHVQTQTHIRTRTQVRARTNTDTTSASTAEVMARTSELPEDPDDPGDAFVASLDIHAGVVVTAVQLALPRSNSADALAFYDRTLIVAVNTDAPPVVSSTATTNTTNSSAISIRDTVETGSIAATGDDVGTWTGIDVGVRRQCVSRTDSRAALFAFALPALTPARLRLRGGGGLRGARVTSLSAGASDDAAVYVGLCHRRHLPLPDEAAGNATELAAGVAQAQVQRVDMTTRTVTWQRDLGTIPPPPHQQPPTIHLSPASRAVFAGGFASSLQLQRRKPQPAQLLQLPLVAISTGGERVASWTRVVVFPGRVVNIAAFVVLPYPFPSVGVGVADRFANGANSSDDNGSGDIVLYAGAMRDLNTTRWWPAVGALHLPDLRPALALADVNANAAGASVWRPRSSESDSDSLTHDSSPVTAVVVVVIASALVFITLVCCRASSCFPRNHSQPHPHPRSNNAMRTSSYLPFDGDVDPDNINNAWDHGYNDTYHQYYDRKVTYHVVSNTPARSNLLSLRSANRLSRTISDPGRSAVQI